MPNDPSQPRQSQPQDAERDQLVRQAQQLGLNVDPDADVKQLRDQVNQAQQR